MNKIELRYLSGHDIKALDMIKLVEAMLAYELLAGLVATTQRGQTCSQAGIVHPVPM